MTTTGLWVLAAVAGAAGLVAIGSRCSRYMAHGEVGRARPPRTRLSVGGDRWTATFAAALPVAVGGAAIALVGAALASPIFPLGVARRREPDRRLRRRRDRAGRRRGARGRRGPRGRCGRAAGATRRVERERARPALPTATATRAGLPTTMSTGIGFALERGQGRGGVPVRSSLVGAAFGVLGIVAALLLGASLDRLVTTPAAVRVDVGLRRPPTAAPPTTRPVGARSPSPTTGSSSRSRCCARDRSWSTATRPRLMGSNTSAVTSRRGSSTAVPRRPRGRSHSGRRRSTRPGRRSATS